MTHPEIYKSHVYASIHNIVIDILDRAQPGDFVVFDIDDTVLRGYGPTTKPHEIGMTILREAKNRNIPVYYVTARVESAPNRLATFDDLERVGIIPHSSTVFMRPSYADTWPKISKFKTDSRNWIEDNFDKKIRGNCLMTIGDQWTDLMTFTNETDRDEMDMNLGKYYVLFSFSNNKRQWGLKLK